MVNISKNIALKLNFFTKPKQIFRNSEKNSRLFYSLKKSTGAKLENALQLSQLRFHTLLLLFIKHLGTDQLTTFDFCLDYDIITIRHKSLISDKTMSK